MARRIRPLVVVYMIGIGVASPTAARAMEQDPTDLAGRWTLVSERSEANGTGAFGDRVVIAVSESGRRVTIVFNADRPAGRGQTGRVTDVLHADYWVDGFTKTNITMVFATASRTEIAETAMWDDSKRLIIRRMSSTQTRPGSSLIRQKVLSIDRAGLLRVETTSSEDVGTLRGSPIVNYYRRAPR